MTADASPGPAATPTSTRSRVWYALAVLACCLATFAAKWWTNQPRVHVNHGDISFYMTVARNLAEGRGFVIDYVWNHWANPEGIPTPSNVWWMPLPSILAAIGMRLGDMDYVSAQWATITFSSLLPLSVYLLGRDLWNCRRVGLVGAALSTTFHLFLDQPSAPLSHCPYVVLAPFVLWTILRATERPGWLFVTGCGIALTQLSRSDGILLFATTGVAFLVAARRPPLRAIGLLVLGYALVMSPWWARNVADFGVMQPGGSMRSLVMSEYRDWYALPESVTVDTWLEHGWEKVLEKKGHVAQTHTLPTLAFGMVSGAARRGVAWDDPFLVATMVLSWIGLLSCLKRRFVFVLLHAIGVWAFYTLLFTEVAAESFRTGMYSVYPFLVLCAGRGLQTVAWWLALLGGKARRARLSTRMLAVGVLVVMGGQLAYAKGSLEHKSAGIDRIYLSTSAVRKRVIEPLGLEDEVFMTALAHNVHAMIGLKCVGIPFEPEPVLRQVARRYGADYVLILGDRDLGYPVLKEVMGGSPHYERLVGPVKVGINNVSVYRILHPD